MNLFQQQTNQGNPIIAQIRQNPRAYVGQLKADPAGFLRQLGVNVPQGVDMSNPVSIIQALYGSPPAGMFGRR